MINVSWEKYSVVMDALITQLQGREFDTIIGIARSGLIPAVQLSHALGVRDFESLSIIRTTSDELNAEKLSAPTIFEAGNLSCVVNRNVLLVDDIVGEGVTLSLAKNYLQKQECKVTSVALYLNGANYKSSQPYSDLVDVLGEVVEGWVVFPWC